MSAEPAHNGDPYEVLGLPKDVNARQVSARRRFLASVHHPDVGGDPVTMAAINRAHDDLMARLEPVADQDGVEATAPVNGRLRVDADHPSFVIDALPVVAFEVLLLAARVLGDVSDDDPPYLIEAQLEDPPMTWCRLELVPDAGSTTVSVSTDSENGAEVIRDIWIRAVNELRIEDIDG